MMISEKDQQLKIKLSTVLALLNERQRRILCAYEAKAYGYGGVKRISEMTGISRPTIYKGLEQLGDHKNPDRVRKSGGGRKKIIETESELTEEGKKAHTDREMSSSSI